MGNFLGFTLYYEQSQTGWNGTAFNQTTKIELSNIQTLQLLKDELRLKVLECCCQNDMGASYVFDNHSGEIVYSNLPCQSLSEGWEQVVKELRHDESMTTIGSGLFDGRNAQYRIKIESFERYSLCRVLGVFVEPNLLAIG